MTTGPGPPSLATERSIPDDSPRFGGWGMAAAVLVLTLVGFGLRVAVAQQDLFADELSTYWIVATHNLGGVISTVNSDAEITPPLSFVVAWLSTQVDLSPEWLRAPSVLAGTLTIPLVFWVGARTVGRARGPAGGGAHDARTLHGLLLGRGPRLRRDDRAGHALDPGDAAGCGRSAVGLGPLCGGVRCRRLHPLHERVRARGAGPLGPVGASGGPPPRADRQCGGCRRVPPVGGGISQRPRLAHHQDPVGAPALQPRSGAAQPRALVRGIPVRERRRAPRATRRTGAGAARCGCGAGGWGARDAAALAGGPPDRAGVRAGVRDPRRRGVLQHRREHDGVQHPQPRGLVAGPGARWRSARRRRRPARADRRGRSCDRMLRDRSGASSSTSATSVLITRLSRTSSSGTPTAGT